MKSNLPTVSEADPNAMSIDDAKSLITQQLPPVTATDTVTLNEAHGRVVANDIHSTINVPPFRSSAMDGYASRLKDCQHPLTLSGSSLAGHPGKNTLPPQTAQRITTGARVPDDADVVIQQENVDRQGDVIIVNKQPTPGLNIREVGSDTKSGNLLIEKGKVLNTAQIAVLAAHGLDSISVVRKLKIAIFSTGDELVNQGVPLEKGQIYDTNRPLLTSLLNTQLTEVIDIGICKDSKSDIEKILNEAPTADWFVSSGGVSVGDADFVREVLSNQGHVNLWKVAMKPGRPLTFGFNHRGQVYFGLPGNPVSAALTALIFLKPAIKSVLGSTPQAQPYYYLPLNGTLTKNPGRVEFQRGLMVINDEQMWEVQSTGAQDSHRLDSINKANCLIELDVASTGAVTGDLVKVLPFTSFSEPSL